MQSLNFKPIGYFHCKLDNPNEAPRQPNKDLPDTNGYIELMEGHHFHEALRDMDGFDKIWVLFHFHKNDHWNPTVTPPRGGDKKRGVFATRSPYRPNPIGMSVLDLVSIDGLKIHVGPSDILNGTPILDIKPYLNYIDAFPDAQAGWLEEHNAEKYSLKWSPRAIEQIDFLESQGLTQLRGFILNQLEYEPQDAKKKRLYFIEEKVLLAYRTWRAEIQVSEDTKTVNIVQISSGYTKDDMEFGTDTYKDKALHSAFAEMSFNHRK